MSITGTEQPTKVGVPIADLIAGMYGAYGVLAALHERSTTGRGRVVRTSLLAGMVGVHAYQGTRWTVAGEVPGLAGDHHPSISPYGMFATATAPVQIACGSEGLWRALCGALRVGPGRGGVRHQRAAGRQPRRPDRADRDALRRRSRPSTGWRCCRRPACRRARCGRWTTSTPGTRRCRRGCCSSSTHATQGELKLPGSPIRFDDNPYSGGRSTHLAPPTLGQHDESIREWLDS